MAIRVSSLGLTIVASALATSAILGGLVWYYRYTSPARLPATATATRSAPQPPAPSPSVSASDLARAVQSASSFTIDPPYTIVDGLTVQSGKRIVRLADLDGPQREAVCFDQQGHLWACGLRARAALNNLISGKSVQCKLVRRDNEVDISYCQVDAADLGRRLVIGGWARPAADQQGAFVAELKAASQARAGLWEGGWRIRASREPR